MWKSTRRQAGAPALLAAVVTASLCMPAWAATDESAPAGPGEPAVWAPKEVQFVYSGFTTKYSCDGLRDRVKEMLLALGARKSDLKVTETPCSGDPGHPNPFPGVRIKMSVLQPTDQAPTPDGQTVTAQWKQVDLLKGQFGLNAAGQCELLEQFKQKVLPLFTTRNVDLQSSCVPHQLDGVGLRLKTEVLVTDQKKPSVEKQAAAAGAG
jgi:hypothetical protein